MEFVLVLSITALVCFGIGDTIGSYLSKHVSAPRLMFIDTLVGIVLYNAVVFFSPTTWVVLSLVESFYLLGLSLGTLLGTICLFKGLSTGKAGVVVPIANSYAVTSVLLGIFILGETLTLLQFIGVGIALIGLFFVSFDIRDIKNIDTSVLYGFAALILWGLMTFFADLSTQTLHPFIVVAYNNILMLLFVGSYLLFTRQTFLAGIQRKHIAWGMAMSTIFAIGFLCFVSGFALGSLSIVSVIGAASPIITAVLAHRYLGDKLSLFQYLMIFLVVVGIMLLVV